MMKARHAHRYPHEGVLRFDRRRDDGEILTPYAGRKQAGTWMIDVYLPFQDSYDAMTEERFIALPRGRRRTSDRGRIAPNLAGLRVVCTTLVAVMQMPMSHHVGAIDLGKLQAHLAEIAIGLASKKRPKPALDDSPLWGRLSKVTRQRNA